MENADASKQSTQSIRIIRGLLAQPTGSEDTPWQPVILRSLRTTEAVDFAASAEIGQSADYPAGIPQQAKSCALFLDPQGTPPDNRELLQNAVKEYQDKHKCKPDVVALKGYGLLYVDHTDRFFA